MVRRVPLAVGGLAIVAAALLALGVGPSLPTELQSLAFVAVVLVGAVAAGAGALARVAEGPRSDPLPDPAGGARGPVPGDDVDDVLASIASVDGDRRRALEARVERLAVLAVARTEGCSREEAKRRVATGAWTDDDRAAAYLADDPPSPSLGDRVRTVVRGETTARRRAERAIAAVHRRTEDA